MKKYLTILTAIAISLGVAAQTNSNPYKEQMALNKTTQKVRMEKVGKDAKKIHQAGVESHARETTARQTIRQSL